MSYKRKKTLARIGKLIKKTQDANFRKKLQGTNEEKIEALRSVGLEASDLQELHQEINIAFKDLEASIWVPTIPKDIENKIQR